MLGFSILILLHVDIIHLTLMGKNFSQTIFLLVVPVILTSFFYLNFYLVADVTMENSPGSSASMEHRLDIELRSMSSSSSTVCPGPRPGA